MYYARLLTVFPDAVHKPGVRIRSSACDEPLGEPLGEFCLYEYVTGYEPKF